MTESSSKQTVKKSITIAALLFMMGLIFYMSAQPAEESSGMSDKVCRIICEIVVPGYEDMPELEQQSMIDGMVFWVRKAAHFTEYLVLGVLMYLTAEFYVKRRKRRWWTSLAAGVFYAATDEIHQYFVPGRSCEVRDVMIDSAGVLTGVTVTLLLTMMLTRRKEK